MRSSPSPSWCRCPGSRCCWGCTPSGWPCVASGDSVRSACTDKERPRMIDSTTRISRNPDVVFRSLEEEQGGVPLHLPSGAHHGLNQSGSLIWDLIENETRFADLVDGVRAETEDAPASVDEGVSTLVQGLSARGLAPLA